MPSIKYFGTLPGLLFSLITSSKHTRFNINSINSWRAIDSFVQSSENPHNIYNILYHKYH